MLMVVVSLSSNSLAERTASFTRCYARNIKREKKRIPTKEIDSIRMERRMEKMNGMELEERKRKRMRKRRRKGGE